MSDDDADSITDPGAQRAVGVCGAGNAPTQWRRARAHRRPLHARALAASAQARRALLTGGRCARAQANLMPSSDFNKRVYRAYDDETAIEVAWIEYNNLSPS